MTAQLHRRRRRWGALLLALTTGTASLGATQAPGTQEAGVIVYEGFFTGQFFVKNMSSNEQAAYATGFINGMLVSSVLGAPKDSIEWLVRCTKGMTPAQVAAIILKHLQSHPERWHYQLHFESGQAMVEACGGK
jgi:hypothetical protein